MPVSTIVFNNQGLLEHPVIIEPTIEEMSAIGNLPYVRAYDFTLRAHFQSRELFMPEMNVDMEKIPVDQQGMIEWITRSPRELGGAADEFHGKGVHNPEITDITTGLITLLQGRTFTQEELNTNANVVIISEALARTNNLSVDSIIEIENTAHDYRVMSREGTGIFAVDRSNEAFMLAHRTLEFQVIGIFDVVPEFTYELNEVELGDAIFTRIDLYNRLYMPGGVAEGILNFTTDAMDEEMLLAAHMSDELWFQSIFVLYDPRDLEAFFSEANELLSEFWEMSDPSVNFAPVVASMDGVLQIADATQWVTVIVAIVVLTLIITLFLRDRRHEIGIYMALGDKKGRVMVQILIEIGIIAIVGIALALFIGNLLSDSISRQMLRQQWEMVETVGQGPFIPWELALVNPGAMGVQEMLDLYHVALDISTVITFLSVASVVILTATLIPIWYIVKLEPKEILM